MLYLPRNWRQSGTKGGPAPSPASVRRRLVAIGVAALFFSTSCRGNANNEQKNETRTQTSQTVSYFQVDPSTAATLRGTIRYRGPKPQRTIISMAAESACEQMHADKPIYDDQLVVGQRGGVANVFVYIKTGLEGKTFEPPHEQVLLDQKGCTFVPRIVGVQAGESLAVRNSDAIAHNVHPTPKNNREWNEGMSSGAADVVHRFARREVMIRVKCNIHPWMRSWIAVMEHPYFAVTGPDGSFELKNLPPGAYTVAIWHETLGQLEQSVDCAASSTRSLDFTYDREGRQEAR